MTSGETLRWRSLYRSFGFRLVPTMILVSLPLTVVLALLLTTSASTSLTASAQHKGESVSRA